MKLARPARRKPIDSVTPLINVVFLLLIFFMLTGTIARPDLLNIKPPTTSAGNDDATKAIRVQLDATGALAIDKTRFSPAEIGKAVATRLKADKSLKVVVAADGTTPAGEVLKLLDALRAAGVERVSLSTVRRR